MTPLGFCLRVNVNEKPLNLEKMCSSVLIVLFLIFGFRLYCKLFRCNLAGGDLNRQYKQVTKEAFPTVFHVKELISKILGTITNILIQIVHYAVVVNNVRS